MVPNVSDRGHSFKGVTAYLMHDKEADTSERVAFTETRNLPFQDVERASKFMAWTDMNSETLKDLHAQSEGRDHTGVGRPSEAGNVYHMSLSWRDDQEPSQDQMTQAAHDAVKRLGLDEHQYYLVGHNDTDHSHVHVVVNLVHPVTGKVGGIYKDHDVLDLWANEYQHENGEIVCPNRADKFAAWEQEQPAFSEKNRREEARQVLNDAYHASDSGRAFKAALEAHGFDLALGQRRAIVVVDQNGDVYAPARQIEGVKTRDVNALLKDIDKNALPRADELQDERKHFDRDAAEARQQDALIEAAEAAARQKAAAEDKAPSEAFQAAAHEPYELGSVIRTTGRGAQGVVTGFDDGRYDVTFSNRKTGRQFVGQFTPAEIELIRTPQQQSEFAQVQAAQLKRWTDAQIVRERYVVERIEERRQYWQIDRLEKERDQAQAAFDERSGWLNRYVLRWRYDEARDELAAKEMNLRHAEGRLLTDIYAIQGKRTAELRDELERQGFFVGGKRSDEGLERAHVESKGEQQQKDAKTLQEAQNSPEAAKRLAAIVSARSTDQRAAADEVKAAAKQEQAEQERREEEPRKLQRDMSQEELEEFASALRSEIRGQLDIEQEAEAESTLQRDMTEEELDAYRQRLREAIIEVQSFEEIEEGTEPQRRRDHGLE